ncbi:4-(cytidine 5'-diphospho)-2-C-methyl-D-erythritol kinase [Danxiaibacter flavus]|uniref:4-diphosphocytidyl-2-C-methyl-D-erythritol kinase n=1 Tax=Danxiaibacter flavus TaxID=3049108 RepID=A0ABV3ZDQ5_9BACT|nr:4-(cytidine 5'-diphospho)-2-C-methyl-D-erythritol kinase [Chitinophagaceae bacterium DXS]
MIVFPNCKINLGLNIISKRSDGFHNLETVFYPLPLRDSLEIISDESGDVSFTSSGISIPGSAEGNLCIKAYDLLKKDFPQLPGIKMHLHKSIPIGAGLGGGSADGAYTLLLLNRKFQLAISEENLIDYALQLGSDCPFFIINKPCFATGRGEQMEPLPVDLAAYKFVIVNPQIHINTGWAFSQLSPAKPVQSVKDIVCQPVENWKASLFNDFEQPVVKQYPEIAGIKDTLYAQGAVYASMSGSGSTVYGLFPAPATPQFDFPAHYLALDLPSI